MKSEHTLIGCRVLSFALVISALLTGCAGSPPWGGWSKEPSAGQVQATLGNRETFIYFSQYEIYRRARTSEYVYQENGGWVHSAQLPGDVSESALHVSPSVELVLTDTPENRHEVVKRTYPRTWDEKPTIVAALR